MISFSIIIPVHNAAPFIKGSIESCLVESEFQVEVLCIDDASTDGSVEIIEALMHVHQQIQLIRHNENLGPYESRLDGMKCARMDYVLFLDADDVLEEKALSTLNLFLSNNSTEMLKFGYTEYPSGKSILSNKIENRSDRIRAYLSSSDRLSPEVWTKAYSIDLVRRVLNVLAPCPAFISEDVYLSVVFAHQCITDSFIDKTLIRYNTGSGGTARKNVSEKSLERSLNSYKAVIAALEKYFKLFAPEFIHLLHDYEVSCISDFIHNRIGKGNAGKAENRSLLANMDAYFSRDSLVSYFSSIQLESEAYRYWFKKCMSLLARVKRLFKYAKYLFILRR